jgi:hypothetical protein
MFVVFGAVDLQPRLTLFEFVQLLCLPGLPGCLVILKCKPLKSASSAGRLVPNVQKMGNLA